MSVYESILNAVRAAVLDASLSGIGEDNVKVRMLPKADETIDALPCVVIAPGVGERIDGASFENEVFVSYSVDVAIIAANNHDFATNLGQYLGWRQAIRRAFGGSRLDGVPEVWRVDVLPDPAFDSGLLNQNYAYMGLTVLFVATEQRK